MPRRCRRWHGFLPRPASIDAALDRSRFNKTDLEDQANALVDELEVATDRLKDRVDDHIVNNFDVNEVLRRGMYLDMFMLRHNFSPAAERDWLLVRTDLDRMARLFAVTGTWVPGSIHNSALNKSWTKQVIQRLEETTDQFRSSFDAGLDRSRIDASYERRKFGSVDDSVAKRHKKRNPYLCLLWL